MVHSHIVEHAGASGIPARAQTRGRLLRRLVLFQAKLVADGVRDIVLSPLSLAAGAIGLVFGGNRPEEPFNRLLEAGYRTDDWINLFDQNSRTPGHATLDRLADDIETALRNDHARGGLTAEAEARLRGLAERLRRGL